jgi:hypothetical protein
MPDQPEQPQHAPAPEPPEEPEPEQLPPPGQEDPARSAQESAAHDEPPESDHGRRRRRIVRPWEALDRLDSQWEDPTPIRKRNAVSSLVLTVPEDPGAFDYLGAMGLSERRVVDACQAWLDAQLAADALELGGLARPVVELVPASRLWFVIRVLLGSIVVIDGPGYLTPAAAVKAARVRYRALLLAEVERAGEGHMELDDGEAGEGAKPDRSAEADPAAGEPPASE